LNPRKSYILCKNSQANNESKLWKVQTVRRKTKKSHMKRTEELFVSLHLVKGIAECQFPEN